jgi:hypothetical protein
VTEVDRTIASLRVVTSAIAISLLTFAGVAVAFRDALARPAAGAVADWLPAGVAVTALAAAAGYAALRRQARADLERRAPQIRASADPLAAVLEPYRRLVIVRAALIEAPALLALVGYLAGGSGTALAVAAAAVVLLVGSLPSRAGLQRFADDALQL